MLFSIFCLLLALSPEPYSVYSSPIIPYPNPSILQPVNLTLPVGLGSNHSLTSSGSCKLLTAHQSIAKLSPVIK